MNQDFEKLLKDPSFRNLNPKKIAFLQEMFSAMENQSNEEKVQTLFVYGMKMKQSGLQLTRQESNMIMNVLMSRLSAQEKQKFELLMKMAELLNQ